MADSHDMTDAMAEAHRRYEAERTKRLRTDGLAQYKELKGEYADLDIDPYVEPGFSRDPVVETTSVVIVGGGFAGMLTAVNLTRRGITDFRIIEKAGDFGGTWYWNRYPGCMCDVESYTYMPLLEETGYMPTMKYAGAPEIFEHCQRIATHFGLYEHALFQTEMAEAVWDDETMRWTVTTSRDDVLTARYVVNAGGLLHKAKLPGIPGIENFGGRLFHTSRWDYSFTGGGPTEPMDRLAGKRVGVVGTGATAVQVVPQLAKSGAEVFVFQRTPSAVGVRNNGPTDDEWFRSLPEGWQAERMENFTSAVSGEKPDVSLVDGGWVETMWDDTQVPGTTPEETAEKARIDFEVMEGLRRRVRETIDDPEVAAKLEPWYGKHCKRLCFHDEYLPSFNLPNVHLVDTDGRGVEQINEAGVVVDGTEYPLDLLVFASGFEVTTGYVRRLGYDPTGRDGLKLSERFADGGHTLHGILTAEFPNMMIVSTMQAGFGVNFVHFLSRSTEHIAWLIDTCITEGIDAIEPTTEAEDAWLMELFGVAAGMADYTLTCTPGYYNAEGVVTEEGARNVTYRGNLNGYIAYLDRWRESGDFPGATVVRAGSDPDV